MSANTVILICGLAMMGSGIASYFAAPDPSTGANLLTSLLMFIAGLCLIIASRNINTKK